MKSPMTKARLEEIRAMVADCSFISSCTSPEHAIRNELFETLDAAVREIRLQRDAYEQLAVLVGRLDFDRSESAMPQTEEQWIEFVRDLDDRAQKLIEDEEVRRDMEGGTSA